MQQILVYGDSLSWAMVPGTFQRLPFEQRWPGILQSTLTQAGQNVRVVEDCLNGRRTAFDDPFRPGRNGLVGIEQRIEVNSPLELIIVMLGTNDFQSMHPHTAWHAAFGMRALIDAVRRAPLELGMPIPEILVVSPPPIRNPDGPVLPKFVGAAERCVGLAAAMKEVADERECAFFDAGQVIHCSAIDGVHLDADQHPLLGQAIAEVVSPLLGND